MFLKDFSHVATPGRDPPRYQFPMLTQNCILNFRSSSDVAVIGQRLLRHAAATPVALAATQWKFWADILLADLLLCSLILHMVPGASENGTPLNQNSIFYDIIGCVLGPMRAAGSLRKSDPSQRKCIFAEI